MKKLFDNTNNMNCEQLQKYAFDTHVDCYLHPGFDAKSICDIWLSKNFVGLWETYELKDFFSVQALNQVNKIEMKISIQITQCLKALF